MKRLGIFLSVLISGAALHGAQYNEAEKKVIKANQVAPGPVAPAHQSEIKIAAARNYSREQKDTLIALRRVLKDLYADVPMQRTFFASCRPIIRKAVEEDKIHPDDIPNVTLISHRPILADYVRCGDFNFSKFLLDNGADPNYSSDFVDPVQVNACSAPMLQLLIDYQCNLNDPRIATEFSLNSFKRSRALAAYCDARTLLVCYRAGGMESRIQSTTLLPYILKWYEDHYWHHLHIFGNIACNLIKIGTPLTVHRVQKDGTIKTGHFCELINDAIKAAPESAGSVLPMFKDAILQAEDEVIQATDTQKKEIVKSLTNQIYHGPATIVADYAGQAIPNSVFEELEKVDREYRQLNTEYEKSMHSQANACCSIQ